MLDVLDRAEKAIRLANVKTTRGTYQVNGKSIPAVIVNFRRDDLMGAYKDMAEWTIIRNAAKPCIGLDVSLVQLNGNLYIVRKSDLYPV